MHISLNYLEDNLYMDVAITLEGANGLNWANFQRIALAAEDFGFAGLYRSDHYTNAIPPDRDALELWVSLTWLASHTSRIDFGPLVSPVSFRHPTMTVRFATAVDELSGGRLHLGIGAGWQEREHLNYGWDLLDVHNRLNRFEEGVEIIYRLLYCREPISFSGEFYTLWEATLLPPPKFPGKPPILIGGNGKKKTLPLAAKYASMWNGIFLTPKEFKILNQYLDAILAERGRRAEEVHRSLMIRCWFGDTVTLQKRLNAHRYFSDFKQLQAEGTVMGDTSQVVEHLGQLDEAGVQRIILRWEDLDDLVGLEKLAASVLTQL
jgi:F420-dependent oxidoreductase-like protein